MSDREQQQAHAGVERGRRLQAYASRKDIALAAIAVAVVAIVVPLWVGGYGKGTNNLVLLVETYMILALGLNIVVGYTGLLDLGYVLFVAGGALLTAFLTSLTLTPDGTIDWPIGKLEAVSGTPLFAFEGGIFVILAVCGLFGALLGFVRGIPTLRVSGDYYAIVTLGVAEVAYEVSLWERMTRITGGAHATQIQSTHFPVLLGTPLQWFTPHFYYFVLAILALTFLLSHHLNRSRIGRALAAIRLDETAARASGVNVAKHKVIAFAVSGFIGGMGGCLVALLSGTVSAKDTLSVWQSILILCCIVLGGMGSLRGVAVGTAVLIAMGELLRKKIGGVAIPPEARFLVYGILLIVFMRFRPAGFFPPKRRGRPLSDAERQALLAGDAPLFTLAGAAGAANAGVADGEAAGEPDGTPDGAPPEGSS